MFTEYSCTRLTQTSATRNPDDSNDFTGSITVRVVQVQHVNVYNRQNLRRFETSGLQVMNMAYIHYRPDVMEKKTQNIQNVEKYF